MLSDVDGDIEMAQVDLPRGRFFVVQTASLHCTVRPHGLRVLETSRVYELELVLRDDHGHRILITDVSIGSQFIIFDFAHCLHFSEHAIHDIFAQSVRRPGTINQWQLHPSPYTLPWTRAPGSLVRRHR